MAKEGLKLSVHEMEASVLHPDKIADGTIGTLLFPSSFFCFQLAVVWFRVGFRSVGPGGWMGVSMCYIKIHTLPCVFGGLLETV
jgi:hypothetical protein